MIAANKFRSHATSAPAASITIAVLGMAMLFASTAADAGRVMLSGTVRSTDAEPIYVPMSNTSPVVLQQMAVDGSPVAAGDVLVRIDPGPATAQINGLETQIALAQARLDKERAELEVRRVDAALALVDAEAALGRAEVDAVIPAAYIARIDYDRYQGEAERARREIVLKRRELENAAEAVQRRDRDGRLEIDQLQADRIFAERQISRSEQRATKPGTVVLGFHPWSGQRFQEGLSANSGMVIGEVVGAGDLAVRAWALEVDRPGLAIGQAVTVSFDAVPGKKVGGKITGISGAPEPKAEWGGGRYFTIDVALDAGEPLPLRPGMSARIDADDAGSVIDTAAVTAAGAGA